MRSFSHLLIKSRAPCLRSFPTSPYRTIATSRRICNESPLAPSASATRLLFTPEQYVLPLSPAHCPLQVHSSLLFRPRAFASSATGSRNTKQEEEVGDPPIEPGAGSEAGKDGPKRTSSDQKSDESSDESGEKAGEEGNKDQKKEDLPPPPPHGDKTPWQVFTETLKSEFQASKEWSESTKALASSAHQFTENESVKRARAAYSAASGAATSTTSSALKNTGKVIGQGAAWTWDTPVVKGVRSSVSATGRGLEKATRPVRETQVFKTAVGGVKDVIDDGSSSRYGGWVEKEERRKQRELRELNEAGGVGRPGKRVEKAEEDPK